MKKVAVVVLGTVAIVLSVFLGMYLQKDVLTGDTQPVVNKRKELDTIAVVNMDDGIKKADKILNYGADLIKNNEGYVVTSLIEARDGVEKNIYAGYIVVPENFSTAVDSINKTPEMAKLTYEVNPNLTEKSREEAIQKIDAFENDLDYKVGYMYLTSILTEFHTGQKEVGEVLENDVKNAEVINAINALDLTVAIEIDPLENPEPDIAALDLEEERLKNEEIIASVKETITTSQEEVAAEVQTVTDAVNAYGEDVATYEEEVGRINALVDADGNEIYNEGVSLHNDFLIINQANPNAFTQYINKVIEDTIRETELRMLGEETQKVIVNLSGIQSIYGSGTIAGGNFTYTLKPSTNNDSTGYSIAMPEGATVYSPNTAGIIDFGKITFTKEGTYKFIVQAVIGNQDGYAYDTVPTEVTITVTRNPLKKLITSTSFSKAGNNNRNGIQFSSSYVAPELPGDGDPIIGTPMPAMISVQGKKVILGDTSQSIANFNYKLSADVANPSGYHWDVNGQEVTEETVGNVNGSFTFSGIVFTQPGTYAFHVSEIADTVMPSSMYDTNVIKVTVVVTENTTTNTLETQIKYNTVDSIPTFYGHYGGVEDVNTVPELGLNSINKGEIKEAVIGYNPTGTLSGELKKVEHGLVKSLFVTPIRERQTEIINGLQKADKTELDEKLQSFSLEPILEKENMEMDATNQNIEQIFSSVESKVTSQESSYVGYVSETQMRTSEYAMSLTTKIQETKQLSDQQITEGLTSAKDTIGATSEANSTLLEGFTSRLSYSKKGESQNKEVKDHILEPTDKILKGEITAPSNNVLKESNEESLLAENSVFIINGLLGIILVSAIGYVIYTKKVKA